MSKANPLPQEFPPEGEPAPIDKALQGLWLEKLRGGEYQQGTGCLRNGDRYCCLGVLCDLSGEGHWEEVDRDDESMAFCVGDYASRLFPPIYIMERVGLMNSQTLLSKMNDRQRKSFAEIANWLEKSFAEQGVPGGTGGASG